LSDSQAQTELVPKAYIPITLGLIVSIVGFVVVLAWLLKINELITVLPHMPTMKISTAISFVFSGLVTFSIAVLTGNKNAQFVQILLPASTLVIVLFMATISTSIFLGISTGIENLLITNLTLTDNPSARPSDATIINFFLIATTGFLTFSTFSRLSEAYTVIGIIISIIGVIAIVGFLTNQPVLYYSFEGISNAMAIHTAILFATLGACLILCGHLRKYSNNIAISKAI
jgi:hypothetical protein